MTTATKKTSKPKKKSQAPALSDHRKRYNSIMSAEFASREESNKKTSDNRRTYGIYDEARDARELKDSRDLIYWLTVEMRRFDIMAMSHNLRATLGRLISKQQEQEARIAVITARASAANATIHALRIEVERLLRIVEGEP